jgi:hypothetical protein
MTPSISVGHTTRRPAPQLRYVPSSGRAWELMQSRQNGILEMCYSKSLLIQLTSIAQLRGNNLRKNNVMAFYDFINYVWLQKITVGTSTFLQSVGLQLWPCALNTSCCQLISGRSEVTLQPLLCRCVFWGQTNTCWNLEKGSLASYLFTILLAVTSYTPMFHMQKYRAIKILCVPVEYSTKHKQKYFK